MTISTIQTFAESAKLQQTLSHATTLALVMREVGRHEDFKYAQATHYVADVLLEWARIMGSKLRDEPDIFGRPGVLPPPQGGAA